MKKLLLVDDDAKLLRSISRHFDELGYDVESCISAAEARVLLGRQRFDAIVCDNQMVGTNGTTLLAETCQQYPDMARFMLSGNISNTQEYLLNWEIGVEQIFSKPCDLNELADAIEKAMPATPNEA